MEKDENQIVKSNLNFEKNLLCKQLKRQARNKFNFQLEQTQLPEALLLHLFISLPSSDSWWILNLVLTVFTLEDRLLGEK